ncbi:thiamine phosphate synthase [Chryseobacterium luquanense]|uniref:Thiamine-phosphate synthase n=1 Tax=Chryseobacterium luquanense TaxID=2983766 RepID=A0ABT3Y816_9FLAO|nr:thiamine phosphate synthase [Chryseobacterium luquanense]MCX8534214.1 thiamine phosphate synthase [Chryseobacterium luquanense]
MSVIPSFSYQLYLVISEADCKERNFLDVAEQAILGGVDIIQLREKNASDLDFFEKAIRLKEITNKYGVPLIINDNAFVAKEIDAFGIHVGNNDIQPSFLRENLFHNKMIGYSIEYLEQLENQETALSDYLGISPVFKTNTKTDTVTEWGLEGLMNIRKLTDKPLVAIGNIHLKNTKAVMDAGADCIAIVSEICGAENPQKAAFQLKNEINK